MKLQKVKTKTSQRYLWCGLAVLAVCALLPDMALASGGLDEFAGPFEKVVKEVDPFFRQFGGKFKVGLCHS